ncbi:MAG: MerR family transcriptional regulator [Gemmatimonadales bacterium]
MATKKLYFKIGEACKKLDIQPYVLRYWETEFPALSPNKSKSGQRVYTPEDLQVIGRIKELLYEEGFTIAGAKKKLEAELKTGLKPPRAKQEDEGAGEQGAAEAAPEPEVVVDEAAVKELEAMRQGVEKALAEARSLLEYLDSEKKSS